MAMTYDQTEDGTVSRYLSFMQKHAMPRKVETREMSP